MKLESNLSKKETSKPWKYVESLGKSSLLALLISLGVNEAVNAQNQNKEQDKKIRTELINKAHTVGLKIYEKIYEKFKNRIPPGTNVISFKNINSDKEICFGVGYTESYLDIKEKNGDTRYVDENGDGQIDRMIASEEEFKSDVEKTAKLSPLTSSEKFLKSHLDFSKMGEKFSEKIKVYLFKDIDKTPRFVIYDFNDGTYGETDAEQVYELWLKCQEKYTKSLENFSAEMHQ